METNMLPKCRKLQYPFFSNHQPLSLNILKNIFHISTKNYPKTLISSETLDGILYGSWNDIRIVMQNNQFKSLYKTNLTKVSVNLQFI